MDEQGESSRSFLPVGQSLTRGQARALLILNGWCNGLNMSMEEDSAAKLVPVGTYEMESGPCAGGMARKKRNFRRLRSLKTGQVIHVKKEKSPHLKKFDPKAWYVAVVKKRWTELKSRDFLNSPQGFVNDSTLSHYHVEAYVATQTKKGVENIVIHGKLFIRVDEENRIDVLRKCQYLKCFTKDPSLLLTENNFTDFARVPDIEIERLKVILEIADGTVEYSDEVLPQVHDTVKLSDGILSESEVLRDLEGSIELLNGRKYVTVILDNIGCFKFRLPLTAINKLRR